MKMKRKLLISVFIILTGIILMPHIAPRWDSMYTVEASSVGISKTKKTLNVGESYTLKVTGTSKKVEWYSSNKSVATVNNEGKVKAKKKGTTIITAKVGKKLYSSKVKVEKPKINKTSKTIYVGKTYDLKVTGTTQKVKWSSSDEKVASVSSKGKVTAKKIGKAVITATVGKTKYTCKIKITKNPVKDAYLDYIKKYKFNTKVTMPAESYSIFDINNDGVEELLVKSFEDDYGFMYTSIFTYDKSKKKVVFVKEIYSYGQLRYSKQYNELFYAEVKSTLYSGGYVYCKLSNNKITETKAIAYIGKTYELYRPNKKMKTLTQKQAKQYLKQIKFFKYTYIPQE